MRNLNNECIKFINVSKAYNINSNIERNALTNITFTINKGDFVGIAGKNGSGKSTLVRMINGLILPTSGEVRVNGMNTLHREKIKNIRSLAGMVFQNPNNQIISPIVEEDISFGPSNLGLSKQEIKERTDWALKILNLEKFRYSSPHLLSGGEKQKVAIASALAMRPSYLVLDEPTAMLDNESRKELLSILKLLNEKFKMTIILISHRMEDMAEANRLVVLEKGEIYLDNIPWKLFIYPEKLEKLGISPPRLLSLMSRLREIGYDIENNITTLNQAEECICRLLK